MKFQVFNIPYLKKITKQWQEIIKVEIIWNNMNKKV